MCENCAHCNQAISPAQQSRQRTSAAISLEEQLKQEIKAEAEARQTEEERLFWEENRSAVEARAEEIYLAYHVSIDKAADKKYRDCVVDKRSWVTPDGQPDTSLSRLESEARKIARERLVGESYHLVPCRKAEPCGWEFHGSDDPISTARSFDEKLTISW